jgi:hypothetical protein
VANTLAYGFVGLQHLFAERLTDGNVMTVYDAVRESIAEYNRQVGDLLSGIVTPTTEYKMRYALPTAGTLQPLDEYGIPRPVRPSGYYDIALPIQGGGTAWGDNRVTRALMTVEEANRRTLMVQGQDADWMRRHVLAAIFDNTTWTYDDPQYGDLVIQPLANSDTVTYNKIGGTSATDTHYLAQAGDIATTNPFPTIHAELMEHPSNAGGPVVAYIPSNIMAAVKALTNFLPVANPDVQLGADSNMLTGSVDAGFGDELLGQVDKVWIVEWRALPDNYIIAHARGAGPFLGMRQYPAAELQGLFQETHTPDGNLQETRFIRYAGFGVMNRIAAVVQRVGNGTYAIPTGYSAPLAV